MKVEFNENNTRCTVTLGYWFWKKKAEFKQKYEGDYMYWKHAITGSEPTGKIIRAIRKAIEWVPITPLPKAKVVK